MAAITRERTARHRHSCSRCAGPIEPGVRYQECRYPPGGEFGYQGWATYRVHLSDVECDYELASWPVPDAPDGPWEDQAVPGETTAATAGEG